METLGAPELHFASLPMAADRGVGWKARARCRAGGVHRRLVLPVPPRGRARRAAQSGVVLVEEGLRHARQPHPAGAHRRSIRPNTPGSARSCSPSSAPTRLKEMLPSLQKQAIDIVDEIAKKGECEVVADLAIPYPSQVFLTLFGLPLEDRDRLVAVEGCGHRAGGVTVARGRRPHPRNGIARLPRRGDQRATGQPRTGHPLAGAHRRRRPRRHRGDGPELSLRARRARHRHRGDDARRCWNSPAIRNCARCCARIPTR